ncbi:MAG TPA: hypothetical protein VMB83_05585 [Roseiarcus sp.]|jgi:hypothetical protein|nr:hypothetical protein [Roseiarcus sp.]
MPDTIRWDRADPIAIGILDSICGAIIVRIVVSRPGATPGLWR